MKKPKATFEDIPLGMYEKALSKELSWSERLSIARQANYDFVEMSIEDAASELEIDVKERLSHSLDDIIEPEIERKFGILVSEDDFSASGNIDYKPASINGKVTDFEDISSNSSKLAEAIERASEKRDKAKSVMKNDK